MNPELYRLLLVAEAISFRLPEPLTEGRFAVQAVAPEEAELCLGDSDVDAVLVRAERCDEELPRLLKRWKELRPRAQFLVFLAESPTTRALVSLMHAGAQDVLDDPSGVDWAAVLDSLIGRIQFVRLRHLERLQAKQSVHYTGLVGESPEMVNVYDQMLRAARLSCPVLVAGETGTGKGLVAHAIHALSDRNGKPFVTVDCGCLAPTLIESELYGVTRGAYTGATSDRSGLVQAAQEGTLFLDEIGELPIGVQPKLLRLLEEGEVRRLGSHRSTPVNIRVISATSRDLDGLIASDQFRLDLYYRLNVLTIDIPPLRQRAQDIPLLARHFTSRHLVQGEPATISEAAIEILGRYGWPGNVRELKNCIEAAIATASGSMVHTQNLPRRLVSPGAAAPGTESVNLEFLERQAIRRALELSGGDKRLAAGLLGIGKTTLYRKLKQMGPLPTATGEPGKTYLM